MRPTRRQLMTSTIAAAAAGSLGLPAYAQAAGKTLVIGIAADPTGLDPEAVENNTSGFIMAAIYDSLVHYKTGSTEVEPGLAERWEVTPDGLQYTFHLKPGVMFQDGTKLDAKAFVETLARQLDKTSPIYIYNTGPVEGYEDFTFGPVESYRAVDDQTVEFKSSSR